MSVVVITGCSSGLGSATALAFARRGDRVYATMRGSERGAELLDTAHREALAIRVLELDVTSDESVEQAIDAVLGAEGRIDVLVNNAAVVSFGSVELLPDDFLRSTFETNLFGPVPAAASRSSGDAAPALRDRRQRVLRGRPHSRAAEPLRSGAHFRPSFPSTLCGSKNAVRG